jgi:hypothetical protein
MQNGKNRSALGAFMEEQANADVVVKKPGQKTQKKGHKTRRHHHDDLMEKKAQLKHDELNKNSQYRPGFKKEE